MYRTTQTQNFYSDLFDVVALDDFDLTRPKAEAEMGKKLESSLRDIPNTIHAASLALFQLDTASLSGEASSDDG